MSQLLYERLSRLADGAVLPLLCRLRRGIEKESLRVDSDGELAQTPHATALGSALTHPMITTDYSEALLEFITPVSTDIETMLTQLDDIHRFVYSALPDEMLWTASMPCALGRDDEIPVAQYGSSNSGRMKTVYRVGLGYRYGRRMQTISGIHYNFSLPDALWPHLLGDGAGAVPQQRITAAYFGLIRNFRRYVWLLIYLFGASPALCRSFLDGKPHRLQELDDYTLYQPFGTSLRMGDLGYQSNAQERLNICYNRLDSYISSLKKGILNPHPEYERIGVLVDGEYRQLSSGLLQIENEFYSAIRPKRVSRRGETALAALAHGGVEYIEVRCIDVNPMMPTGIDAPLVRFLDAFLLFCLISDSLDCDDDGHDEVRINIKRTVNEGRRADLVLQRDGAAIGLRQWATQLLDAIEPVAALLDRAHASDDYRHSVAQQRAKIADDELTPSARVLAALREERTGYAPYVRRQSEAHALHFRSRPPEPGQLAEFVALSEGSLRRQAEIEAADTLPFDEYLRRYFAQYREL